MEKELQEQSQYKRENQTGYQPEQHVQDVNNRVIFNNHRLTAQFLNNYTSISIFSGIREEDIEDVTRKYQAFLGVTFETDTVKKVVLRCTDGTVQREVYVISMIEHKSRVDYDVAMQLFRYVGVIWHEFGKIQNKQKKDSSSLKSFRYPLIIPIVYYEGKEKWTAGRHLKERIDYSAGTEQYIPDFQYQITGPSQYTNEELIEKGDEMSLVMLMNKIQTPEDLEAFRELSEEIVNAIYRNAPTEIQEIYEKILWGLLMKMKVPNEEAKDIVDHVRGGHSMGYLFENMDKIDIQAERRKTQKQRALTEQAEKERDAIKSERDAAKEERDAVQRERDAAQEENEALKKQLEEYQKRYGELK